MPYGTTMWAMSAARSALAHDTVMFTSVQSLTGIASFSYLIKTQYFPIISKVQYSIANFTIFCNPYRGFTAKPIAISQQKYSPAFNSNAGE